MRGLTRLVQLQGMLIRVRAQRAQFNNDPLSAATYVSEREGVGRPAGVVQGHRAERPEERGARGPAGRSGQRRAAGGHRVARIGIPNDWREIVEALARVPAAP
jgi:hypothetical protein